MRSGHIVVCVLLLAGAGLAWADFSPVGSSATDPSTRSVLQTVYGGTFVGAEWGGLSYTNGTVTATRVDDWAAGKPHKPGDKLALDDVPGLPATDQVWAVTAPFEARAVFGVAGQTFGYFTGSGVDGPFEKLFEVGGTGFSVTGGGTFELGGQLYRWGLGGQGFGSSRDAANPGSANRLLTYQVTGLPAGPAWLLFWEDGVDTIGDGEFGDMVIELKAVTVPAPGAALLGLIGFVLIGRRVNL